MWNLTFIENLLHAKPHSFMSLCILPNKHFVLILQQRKLRFRKGNDLSIFSKLVDADQDSHQFCLTLLQSSLLPSSAWRKRSVSGVTCSNQQLRDQPHLPNRPPSPRCLDCFSVGSPGREKPGSTGGAGAFVLLTEQHYPLPSKYNFNLPFLQILLLHFFCKRKWSCHPNPIIWVLTLLQTLGCPSIKYWIDLSRSRLEKIKIKSPLKTYFIS